VECELNAALGLQAAVTVCRWQMAGGDMMDEDRLIEQLQVLSVGGEWQGIIGGVMFRIRRREAYYLASDLYGIPDDLDGEAFDNLDTLTEEIKAQVMK